MTALQAKLLRVICITIFIALIPLLVFTFPKYLTHVENFQHKITSFHMLGDDVAISTLPMSLSSLGKKVTQSEMLGSFFVSAADMSKASHMYIPFYVGKLKISAQNEIVFDSSLLSKDLPILTVLDALIEIPKSLTAGNQDIEFRFVVSADRTGMISIGNIYFGDEENFFYPHLKNIFYYETYRTAMLGAQIILLLLLISAFLAKGLGSEAIPPIVILIFFVLLGSAVFPDLISNRLEINQLTIALAPAVVVVLLNFFHGIYYENIYKNYTFILYGVLLFAIVVFTLIWTGAVELVSYNAFVSAPSLIGGLTLLSLASVFLFMKSQRMEIGLWAISSTFMVFSLAYDIMFRFGVLDTGAATVTLSSSVFVIILSAMFVNTILRTKNQLSQANNVLLSSLDEQSQQLEAEFASSAKMVRDAAIASEKIRLMQELHDGVLTYLGIVSVLSEDGSDKTMQKINQLSRYALNEIRVILEARPSDQNSLTIALGALRGQMVDPLRHLGIEVEWSTQTLLDYGTMEPKALMDTIRIIQEAIHNAVVRGGCTDLTLVSRKSDDRYTVTISNWGGQSFSEENRKGHGIINMTERAEKIGGKLSIEPLQSGAILTLALPPGKGMAR